MEKPLIILTGPTAVGKTALSIALAKQMDGEIISADSMQVYQGMDIGTAKIRKEKMEGIPHHLIDILSPDEEFNVVKFKNLAKEAMNQIYEKGKIPIIVGGTGFYIQSVLYEISFAENQEDKSFRRYLEDISSQEGGGHKLYEQLKLVDLKAANAIHENNVKKVIRALEFFWQTGKCISAHNEEERKKTSPYRFCYFALNQPREILYERINTRIDLMLQEGLVKEVETLKEKGYDSKLVSMQGLGYKEILQYLSGEITLEEAIYILKRNTRHFSKRQITWFKREKDVIWIEKENFKGEEEILNYMIPIIKEKLTMRKIRTQERGNHE